MSGAVQSGYRAVAEILYDLKPLALTDDDKALIKNAATILPVPASVVNKPNWKPKYPSSSTFWKLLDFRFLVGLTAGLIVMHPRFQIVDKISTWARKAAH